MKLRSASTWIELYALEGFVPDQLSVTDMVTGMLVGQYEMSPALGLRACGIASCSKGHRHGFIVELPDGRVSNVGRDCGRMKFGALWTRLLKRFRAEKKKLNAQEALENVRAEGKALLASVHLLPAQLQQVREQLAALNSLPVDLREELSRRAQAGTDRIVQWREPTREEVDRAKFHGKRIPIRTEHLVGVIRSIKAVAPHSRADTTADVRLPKRIRELQEAFDNSQVTADELQQKIRALKEAWALLELGISRAADFFTSDNIAILRHLDPRGAVKRIVVNPGPPFSIQVEGDSAVVPKPL